MAATKAPAGRGDSIAFDGRASGPIGRSSTSAGRAPPMNAASPHRRGKRRKEKKNTARGEKKTPEKKKKKKKKSARSDSSRTRLLAAPAGLRLLQTRLALLTSLLSGIATKPLCSTAR